VSFCQLVISSNHAKLCFSLRVKKLSIVEGGNNLSICCINLYHLRILPFKPHSLLSSGLATPAWRSINMVNTTFIYDILNSCNVCVDYKRIFSNKPKLMVSKSLLLYL
jgi:hypothetical protein